MVYHGLVPRSAHSLRICRLYRRILKEQLNWTFDRQDWNEIARATSETFKAYKNVSIQQAETLAADAEKQLEYWKHPSPIIC